MRRLSRRELGVLMLGRSLQAADGLAWKLAHRPGRETAISDFGVSENGIVAAAGVKAGRGRPIVMVRSSSGEWDVRTLPERAVSLNAGSNWWITAESGLWRSEDHGVNWKLALKASGLLRVYFVTDAHGYALGSQKTILETSDAGQTWIALAAAAESSSSASYAAYHWVEFVTPKVGIITGASRPPRAGRTSPLPAWRDPQPQSRRAEWPGASLTLETRDGGATWKHSSTSLFGRITRVRYARDGKGLALVEFHDVFDWPSELFSIDLRTGRSERVFRRKDRAVTDMLLFPGGKAFLAAIEPPADPSVSTLGNVRILASEGLSDWTEMTAPDGLKAGRVWLGGNPVMGLWAATDTGVVLQA